MPRNKNKNGFTLVELLAVTIILIIIMTTAIVTVNKQMEKATKNAFIADVNLFAKGAQQKYSSDKSNHAVGEDLFHNVYDGKVCYSIEQQLIGQYAEKTSESYTGSVEICYGETCDYTFKIWATDGTHYIDGETSVTDKSQIKNKYTTDYPLTCGVEALGGGGTGGDLLTAEFEQKDEEYTMTIVKDGVYALEGWGAQGGNYSDLRGGYGGYSYTEIELHVGDKLYINVGSQGKQGKAGYNNAAGTDDSHPVGGGGATSITTKPGFLSPSVLPDYVYLVAGGGAAAAYQCCCCDGSLRIGASGGGANSEALWGSIGQSGSNYGKATYPGAGGGYRADGGGDCCRPRGGSGFIGNPLTRNGVMYGYNVANNDGVYTKTISTRNISEAPRAGYAKMGDGFAKITYIGTFTETESEGD